MTTLTEQAARLNFAHCFLHLKESMATAQLKCPRSLEAELRKQ